MPALPWFVDSTLLPPPYHLPPFPSPRRCWLVVPTPQCCGTVDVTPWATDLPYHTFPSPLPLPTPSPPPPPVSPDFGGQTCSVPHHTHPHLPQLPPAPVPTCPVTLPYHHPTPPTPVTCQPLPPACLAPCLFLPAPLPLPASHPLPACRCWWLVGALGPLACLTPFGGVEITTKQADGPAFCPYPHPAKFPGDSGDTGDVDDACTCSDWTVVGI